MSEAPTLKQLVTDFLDAIDLLADLGDQLRERLVPANGGMTIQGPVVVPAKPVRKEPPKPRAPKQRGLYHEKSKLHLVQELLLAELRNTDTEQRVDAAPIEAKAIALGGTRETMIAAIRALGVCFTNTVNGKSLWMGPNTKRTVQSKRATITPELRSQVLQLSKTHNFGEISDKLGITYTAVQRILGTRE